mgnify:FL=1
MVKTAKEKVDSKAKDKGAEKHDEEITVERKLLALYKLQQTDTQIDRIRIVRGELPLEVQDLEDEIIGLETRVQNYQDEIESLNKQISDKNTAIKNSGEMIKKYEAKRE